MEIEDYQLNRQGVNVEKSPASLVRDVLASVIQSKRLDSRVDYWSEECSRAAVTFLSRR